MRQMKKVISLVMVFAVLLSGLGGTFTPPVLASEETAGVTTAGNAWLGVYIDAGSGRFAVLPGDTDFDDSMLKSYAAFTIGGAEYPYGAQVPGAETSFSGVVQENGRWVSQWTVDDYAIQQQIAVIEDSENAGSWAAHVSYDILYVGLGAGDIAMRLLLDTQFGPDDTAPVVVDGEALANERLFTSAPQVYHAAEDTPGPKAYGALAAGESGLTLPEAMAFVNYGNVAAQGSLYSYQADAAQSLAPDSAALYVYPNTHFDALAEGQTVDEEARRVIYSAIYGFYGMAQAEDPVVAPEETPAETPQLAPEAATYKLGADRIDRTLLSFPETAEAGTLVTVVRVAQPDGFIYNGDIAVYKAGDDYGEPVGFETSAGENGSTIYTFTMPDGKVGLSQDFKIADDWYLLRLPEDDEHITFSSSLPHLMARKGSTFELTVRSDSTRKVYLSMFNQMTPPPNYTWRYVDFYQSGVTDPDDVWDQFDVVYTVEVPGDNPGMRGIDVVVSQDVVAASFALPDGMSFVPQFPMGHTQKYYHQHEDMLWFNHTPDYVMNNMPEMGLLLPVALTATGLTGSYGGYEVAVHDQDGNELPYCYVDWGSGNEVFYDPYAGLDGPDQNGNLFTTTRATVADMLDQNVADIARFELPLPAVFPADSGTQLSAVQISVYNTTFYDIEVTDEFNAPVQAENYSLLSHQAAAGEEVTLTLRNTDSHTVSGVQVVDATNGLPVASLTEAVKNKYYTFTMPGDNVRIKVGLDKVPAAEQQKTHGIYKRHPVTKRGKQTYGFTITTADGTEIAQQVAGQKVYLSVPAFDPNCGESANDWTLTNPPFVLTSDGSTPVDVPLVLAGGRYEFTMPNHPVVVRASASAEYRYFNLAVSETADNGGATNVSYSVSPFSFVYVGGVPQSTQAKYGDTVRVILPREKTFFQKVDDVDLPFFMTAQDADAHIWVLENATGRIFAADKVANKYFKAEQYNEYEFQMPESDATIEVVWHESPALDLRVETAALPQGVAAPDIKIYRMASESVHTRFRVQLTYPESTYDYRLLMEKGPGVEAIELWQESDINGNVIKAYNVDVSANVVVSLEAVELAPFPTIETAVQSTKYALLRPWLLLSGKGFTRPTSVETAFDYQFTYTFADGSQNGYIFFANQGGGWHTPFGNIPAGTGAQDTVTVTYNISGVAAVYEKMKELVSLEILAKRSGDGQGSSNWRHLYTAPIEFSDEIVMDKGVYQYLSIMPEEEHGTSYTVRAAASKGALDLLMKDLYGLDTSAREMLNCVSGNGFEYNPDTGVYTLQTEQLSATVAVGKVLTAEVPKGELFEVRVQGGSVTITMSSKTKLAVPNRDIYVPLAGKLKQETMTIALQSGTRYATTYEQYYPDSGADSGLTAIEIAWDNNVLPALVQMTGPLAANVNNAKLFDKSVVLGGAVFLSVPLLGGAEDLISIEAERVKFGYSNNGRNFGYQGMIAQGQAAMPEILSLIEQGAVAEVDINTLSDSYYNFLVDISIFNVGVYGELSLVSYKGGQLLPDTFVVGLNAPIELVPGVFQLQGLKGGFSGLASTIAGDYHLIPKFKLRAEAAFSLAEIFQGGVGLIMGPSEFYAEANAGIGFMGLNIQIVEALSFHMRLEGRDDLRVGGQGDVGMVPAGTGSVLNYEIGGGIRVSFIPGVVFLEGLASVNYGFFRDLINSKTSHYFNIYGRITFQIPRFKFLGVRYGPYTLLQIEMAVTERFARASAKLLGFIKVSYCYDFEKKDDSFKVFSAGESSTLTDTVRVYDEEGEGFGTVTVGENLTLVAASSPTADMGADAGGGMHRMAMRRTPADWPSVSVTGHVHTITVPQAFVDAGNTATVQVTLKAGAFEVIDPAGKLYPLNYVAPNIVIGGEEAGSDSVNALEGENGVVFVLDAPGQWQIRAGQAFDSYVLQAAPLPGLTQVSLAGSALSLTAENLDASANYYISYGLAGTDSATRQEQRKELGAVLVNGSTAYSETLQLGALDTLVDSGRYYAYATLYTDIPGVTAAVPAGTTRFDMNDKEFLETLRDNNSVEITAAKAPPPVAAANIQLATAPNAGLTATWQGTAGANLYEVKLYEDTGNGQLMPVLKETAVPAETGLDISVQEHLTYELETDGAAGPRTLTIEGLPGGKRYTVEVVACAVESSVFGGQTVSNTWRAAGALCATSVPVNEAAPPNIGIANAVDNGAGLELTLGASGALQVLSIDGKACNISLFERRITADGQLEVEEVATQASATELSYTVPGDVSSGQYEARATNPSTGDTARLSVSVFRSSVAPALVIDNLDDGVVASNGTAFSISGVTQPHAQLTALPTTEEGAKASEANSALRTQADADGRFTLTGKISAGQAKQSYSVAASNTGGVTYEAVTVQWADPKDPDKDPGKDPDENPDKDPDKDSGKDPQKEPGAVVTPQTGDPSNQAGWILLGAVAVAGLALCALLWYKKRRPGNKKTGGSAR